MAAVLRKPASRPERRGRRGAAPTTSVRGRTVPARSQAEERILVLQGGGALGAYQAGVYEVLDRRGQAPHWVGGISIGAINAALIAGNPPERRVERLRAFWELVSEPIAGPAFALPGAARAWQNRGSAFAAML